jgi:hypothetical protein
MASRELSHTILEPPRPPALKREETEDARAREAATDDALDDKEGEPCDMFCAGLKCTESPSMTATSHRSSSVKSWTESCSS